jgi:2'-5' RNA ligase
MLTYKEFLLMEKIIPGVFIGVKLSEKSLNDIEQFIENQHIPSPIARDDIHITLIYSKKSFPMEEWKQTKTIKEFANPIKFNYFGDKKNCLVVLLDSSFLIERNAEIVEQYGAISDYDEYHPHLTLSYDCTNCQLDFAQFPTNIELVQEYATPLDDDWTGTKEIKK